MLPRHQPLHSQTSPGREGCCTTPGTGLLPVQLHLYAPRHTLSSCSLLTTAKQKNLNQRMKLVVRKLPGHLTRRLYSCGLPLGLITRCTPTRPQCSLVLWAQELSTSTCCRKAATPPVQWTGGTVTSATHVCRNCLVVTTVRAVLSHTYISTATHPARSSLTSLLSRPVLDICFVSCATAAAVTRFSASLNCVSCWHPVLLSPPTALNMPAIMEHGAVSGLRAASVRRLPVRFKHFKAQLTAAADTSCSRAVCHVAAEDTHPDIVQCCSLLGYAIDQHSATVAQL